MFRNRTVVAGDFEGKEGNIIHFTHPVHNACLLSKIIIFYDLRHVSSTSLQRILHGVFKASNCPCPFFKIRYILPVIIAESHANRILFLLKNTSFAVQGAKPFMKSLKTMDFASIMILKIIRG